MDGKTIRGGVKVVAVANRTLASSRQAAKEFGIESTLDNWEEYRNDKRPFHLSPTIAACGCIPW